MAFPTGWTSYGLAVDHTKVGSGGVTNFDVALVRANFVDAICSPTAAGRSQADGGDLRFTSDAAGTTRLACDVIKWEHDTSDGAGDADVYVRVQLASISSAADTVFYVWTQAGGSETQPAAADPYGQHATYDASTKALCPLEEDPSASQPSLLDRSSNAAHASAINTVAANVLQSAKISSGLHLPGTTNPNEDAIQAGVNTDDSSDWTVAAIINPDDLSLIGGSGRRIFAASEAANAGNREVSLSLGTDGSMTAYLYDFAYIWTITAPASTIATGTWYRVTLSWGSGGAKLLVNGALIDTDASTTQLSGVDTTLFGAIKSAGGDTGSAFDGYMDELRIDSTQRSTAWELTRTNNELDPATFVVEYATGPTVQTRTSMAMAAT